MSYLAAANISLIDLVFAQKRLLHRNYSVL